MTVDLDVRIKLIELDHRHGAGWLARQAVEALAEAVAAGADPLETGRALVAARPEIGAIAGAVGRVLAASRSPEQIAEEAAALVALRDRAANSIAVLLGPSLRGTVMTHSASATVREALSHTPPDRVVCTVSGPEGEGRPFAEDLESEGLDGRGRSRRGRRSRGRNGRSAASGSGRGLRRWLARQQDRNERTCGGGAQCGRPGLRRLRDVQARPVAGPRPRGRALGPDAPRVHR